MANDNDNDASDVFVQEAAELAADDLQAALQSLAVGFDLAPTRDRVAWLVDLAVDGKIPRDLAVSALHIDEEAW